jgi:CRP-like cAMP-binding protein/flavin-dependent dehydrogenase
MELENGSRIGIIGGGPAGSLYAYFLLTFARRADLDLDVEIFEPRNFATPGPAGCNMCGGIVSETLVQALAVEGVMLPASLVQRGIESYVLHTADGRLPIETPLKEKRIAALHRGGGPRDVESQRWGGLDGFLLRLAQDMGAKVVRARVGDVGRDSEGRPEVRVKGEARPYELLVGATGVNSNAWPLFEKLGLPSRAPKTQKTFVTELYLGERAISRHFGNAMHLFLLDIPKLDCAAMVPKGDYVTVCLLGNGIEGETIDAFFHSEPVRRCLPPGTSLQQGKCHCGPRINEKEATRPFVDRVVLVGDCGVSRLYKDGIGGAYRTAKCAARTAVFSGVGAEDFQRHYWPLYRTIARDNRYGALMFMTIHLFKAFPPLLRGALRMASREQANGSDARPMSLVLWDMFTGSAPYRDIFYRTVKPRFIGSFGTEVARATFAGSSGRRRSDEAIEGAKDHDLAEALDPLPQLEAKENNMAEGILGREYADGAQLCRQGEPGNCMFVIQSGRAEVLREEGGRESLVGELGPGDVFGQMAITDGQPRSATVRVKGRARVLTLDKRTFLRRVHEDPSFAFKMLEEMSQIVRTLDDELATSRNVSQIRFVRYVYVVPRNRPELVEQLSREFRDDTEVEVVLDRRRGERRKLVSPQSFDRRRRERRSADDPWSVHLSLPYRRDRGRLATNREQSL